MDERSMIRCDRGRDSSKKKHTEDDVSTIEPGGHNGGDEELRAVGVLSGVSHGKDTGLGVLELEVLIYAIQSASGQMWRTVY